ncbi:MAG: hypothetical protein AAGE03_08000 [Pseudomonadota bacterium]
MDIFGGMRVFKAVAAGLLACTVIATDGAVNAQTPTLRNTAGPAEQPPAGFTGGQYVDSRGCVFIRVGVAGQTRWVPRVNRDRTVVCGQPATRQAAPAPVRQAAPAPEPAAVAQGATAPVQAAEPVIRRIPAPAAPRVIVEPAPSAAPTPPQVAAAPAAAQPAAAPRPRRAAAPRPAPQRVAPRRAAVTVPAVCGASELSARYLRNTPACAAALRSLSAPATATAQPAVVTQAPQVATAPAQPTGLSFWARLFRVFRPVATPVRTAPQTTVSARQATAPVALGAPQVPAPARVISAPAPGCRGASDLSARYLSQSAACTDAPQAPRQVVTSTRGAPAVTAPQIRRPAAMPAPPPGYRSAWDDGRLNPNRGPQPGVSARP